MLRTHLIRLGIAVSLAALATQAARANLYLNVEYASGGGPGSTAYNAVVDPGHENITLNVYALVTETNPANVSTATDQYKLVASNFFVASSALVGDVAFGSWSANAGATGASQGLPYLTTYGGTGLGGSSASVTTQTNWWYAVPTSPALSGAAGSVLNLNSTNIGAEYLLGTLTVSFTRDTLPGTTTTAPFEAIAGNKIGTLTKPAQWVDSTGTYATWGTVSTVGQGEAALVPAGVFRQIT